MEYDSGMVFCCAPDLVVGVVRDFRDAEPGGEAGHLEGAGLRTLCKRLIHHVLEVFGIEHGAALRLLEKMGATFDGCYGREDEELCVLAAVWARSGAVLLSYGPVGLYCSHGQDREAEVLGAFVRERRELLRSCTLSQLAVEPGGCEVDGICELPIADIVESFGKIGIVLRNRRIRTCIGIVRELVDGGWEKSPASFYGLHGLQLALDLYID